LEHISYASVPWQGAAAYRVASIPSLVDGLQNEPRRRSTS